MNHRYTYLFQLSVCILSLFCFISPIHGQGEPGEPGTGPDFAAMRALSLRSKLTIPPSPEAASLGKYGEVEVSHYTGSLNYGIPLPSIGDDKLSWDFALRYDGSGNKPDQLHGQVGQGWSLQGIGVITRTVRGNPDIDLNYYNAKKAWLNNPVTYTDLIRENKFLDTLARGQIETQPDLYHYNFGNHSGKFYIKPDKTIFLEDDANLVITPTFLTGGFANVNGDVLTFSITDAAGIVYVFEFAERTSFLMEPLPTYFPANYNFQYNSAWYLKDVIHPNGSSVAKISFLYDQVATDYTPLINSYQYVSITYNQSLNLCGTQICGNPTTPNYSYANYSATTIKMRKALKEASFYKGSNLIEKMSFINSANTCTGNYGNFKLDRVEIKRGPVTSTKLTYTGLFTYDCSVGRLTLKSFRETSPGVSKEPYTFTYNTTTLPAPGTKEQDFWGYYNSNNGTGMVPNYYQNCSPTVTYLGNGNRNPDETRMKAGILTKITYPTKGYTEIDYEAHRVAPYLGCQTSDQVIGGLRVKEMRHYAKTGIQAYKTQYKYTTSLVSSSSSGLLIHGINFATSGTNTHYGINCLSPCCEISSTYTCTSTTLVTSPLMIPGAVDGYHIGYSRVEEINAGRTVYFFRNAVSSAAMSHSNGDLIKKEIYDGASNLLQKTDYTYWADGATGALPTLYSLEAQPKPAQDNKTLLCKTTSGQYEWRLQCCASGAGTTGCNAVATFESKLQRKYSSIKRRKKYVTKEVITSYSLPYTASQTSLVRQVDYKYDNLNIFLPTEIKTSDASSTEINKVVNRYPTVSGTGVPAGMVTKRMFSDPYETEYHIMGTHVYSAKKNFNSSLPYVPTEFLEKLGTGGYESIEIVNTLDGYSNYMTSTKVHDVPDTYIWSGDGARISAVVRNSVVHESAFTSFDVATTYQGGWSNAVAAHIKNVVNGGASGNGYFNPSSAISLSTGALPIGKYVLSYYTKSTGTITPGTSGATVLRTTNALPLPNGWKYVEHIINKTTTSTYSISVGAGAFIDELRIYPADALMKSVSYESERNLPVCISGEDGTLNRIEYDDLNRLVVMRNAIDEIVQTYEYSYQIGTGTYNAILSRVVQKPAVTTLAAAQALVGADVQRRIDYFDGLGRNDQSVGIDLSPTALEQIVVFNYDTYGRKTRDYLPYTGSGPGVTINTAYRSTANSDQIAFYGPDGAFAFTESILEISPLSRIKGSRAPGATWAGFPTAYSYQFNGTAEVRNPTVASQYYAANTLFKTVATDEDLKVVTTYKDLLGRKIMEDQGGLKTYYLYDTYNNITRVIQPEGSKILHSSPSTIHTAAAVVAHSFIYTYDARFRLSTKKVPGTNGVYTYQYDRLDRPVLVKDPSLFQTFTKYDILSRPVMTGKYTGAAVPAGEALFENKTTSGHFYTTNLTYPTSSTEIYTVNYYDDYDFDVNYVDNITYTVPSAQTANFPAAAYPGVRGKLTGSKAGVLNTSGAAPTIFTADYTFYDLLSRPIYLRQDHPYAGSDQVWMQYHFSGWPLRNRLQHTSVIGGQAKSYIVNDRMTYDHAGRKLTTFHQIGDSGTEVEISMLTYNERDELKTNRIGTNQNVDYKYNIRKWLTDINNTAMCNTSDLFSMKLRYDTANVNVAPTGMYNGNISSIEWRTGANCTVNGTARNKAAYGFTYDAANRLTTAKYGEYNAANVWQAASTDRYTVDNMTYDDNGNLKTLRRNGLTAPGIYGIIDNMTYNYSSSIPNQLTTIAETGLITKGFKKVTAGAPGYTYDANGNVNADGYRGITGTTYHPFNLPSKITYSGTKNIEYTYDATGRKWKIKTVDGAATTEKTYIGGIEYNGTNLEAIYHEQGRAVPLGPLYEYEYAIKDHLGNNRVMFKVVSGTATILQESHVYPFGMEMEGFSLGSNQYRYNGKELQTAFSLGLYDYGFRMYDPAIGRFTGVDPIADQFAWVSTYNYAENSPIANIDLHGLQAVNFMSKFKKPKNLDRKTPGPNAQKQFYSVGVQNAQTSFSDMKEVFLNSPQDILTNSKAEFNTPMDGEGDPSSFKEGSFIKIDIDGPLNNSIVEVMGITEEENSVSATFQTMEGHIEKGIINFTLQSTGEDSYSFTISSLSEVDMTLVPDKLARNEQMKSWIEVLNKIVELSGGEETERTTPK